VFPVRTASRPRVSRRATPYPTGPSRAISNFGGGEPGLEPYNLWVKDSAARAIDHSQRKRAKAARDASRLMLALPAAALSNLNGGSEPSGDRALQLRALVLAYLSERSACAGVALSLEAWLRFCDSSGVVATAAAPFDVILFIRSEFFAARAKALLRARARVQKAQLARSRGVAIPVERASGPQACSSIARARIAGLAFVENHFSLCLHSKHPMVLGLLPPIPRAANRAQAKWSIRIQLHFEQLAIEHISPFVREYATAIAIAGLASLRLDDIMSSVLAGVIPFVDPGAPGGGRVSG